MAWGIESHAVVGKIDIHNDIFTDLGNGDQPSRVMSGPIPYGRYKAIKDMQTVTIVRVRKGRRTLKIKSRRSTTLFSSHYTPIYLNSSACPRDEHLLYGTYMEKKLFMTWRPFRVNAAR